MKHRTPRNTVNLKTLLKRNPGYFGVFLAGFFACFLSLEVLAPHWLSSEGEGVINSCFTPEMNCTDLLIKEISKAEKKIHVRAYSFTSKPIAQALIKAKQNGLDVKVILDKSNLNSNHSVVKILRKAHVPIFIEASSGLAHNKVMILDGRSVITGSFNFTNAAQKRNSENMLLLKDPTTAEYYTQNWKVALNRSKSLDLRG